MTRSPAKQPPHSTKARILATAEEVFAARGFEGASTREIAARAGVNISSLHYHWDSKETLYFAVFQNIYDQLVELLRTAGLPAAEPSMPVEMVVDTAIGRLFDFFNDNPNIPKLLLRRLLEDDERHVGIETDILLPAWQIFAGWTRKFRGNAMEESESTLFMLTAHSVMLLFLLDSSEFRGLLGGTVRTAPVGRRVRTHIIQVVQRLLAPG